MTLEALPPGVVAQFADNLSFIGQQMEARLVPHVNADLAYNAPGDRYTDETFGISEPQQMFSDWYDTPEGKVPQFRRVGRFKTFADGKYFGKREEAEKLINPADPILRAMRFGRERNMDRQAAEGIFAPSMQEIAQDGSESSVTFPASNIIAVDNVEYYRGKTDGVAAPSAPGAGAGQRCLTLPKIRAAVKKLEEGQVDPMGRPPVILYEVADLQNLLTSDEVRSADYVTQASLAQVQSGRLAEYMGLQWVKLAPGTLQNVPGQSAQWYTAIYYPEYIKFKVRPLVNVQIAQRADKGFRWHAFYEDQMSAIRCQDDAVVWIANER